jgi:hypothetical protein
MTTGPPPKKATPSLPQKIEDTTIGIKISNAMKNSIGSGKT